MKDADGTPIEVGDKVIPVKASFADEYREGVVRGQNREGFVLVDHPEFQRGRNRRELLDGVQWPPNWIRKVGS